MTVVFDAATVPDRTRLRRWSEAVARAMVPVTVIPQGSLPFNGRTVTERLGHLLISTIEADPQRIIRTQRRIAHDAGRTERFVAVAVAGPVGARIQQGGRSADLEPGMLGVWDTGRPHVLDLADRTRLRVCLVPRRTLGVADHQLEGVTATAIEPDGPVAAVVGPLLCTLADTAANCPEPVVERLAGNVTDLLATLVAQRAPGVAGDAAGSRRARAREVRAYVDRHLGDPELSPQSIAAAHHMSVRALHKLFEGEEITVSRWIQHRRLEECSRELAWHRPAPTVSAVSRRWGFSNAAHFSRLFRAAYGMPPREWRDTRGGRLSPRSTVDTHAVRGRHRAVHEQSPMAPAVNLA
ncbi:helix-turn-helix domain-containing protein [Streptomyces sp. NPDC054841]